MMPFHSFCSAFPFCGMNKVLLMSVFLGITLSSCGVMSDKQIETVNKMTVGADSLANTPAALFREIAEIRKMRNIYHSASMYSPEDIASELENTAMQHIEDTAFVKKAGLASRILSSYLRALRSLSSERRWSSIGVEIRGVGRNIDDALEEFNEIEFSDFRLPEDYASPYFDLSAKISELYMKGRQKKYVKEFVNISDTLVSACCDAMAGLLRDGRVDSLLVHERLSLRSDFRAYVTECRRTGEVPDIGLCSGYVDLVVRMEKAVYVRKRAATAFITLKNAHKRLNANLQDDLGITMEMVYDDIYEILDLAADLKIGR